MAWVKPTRVGPMLFTMSQTAVATPVMPVTTPDFTQPPTSSPQPFTVVAALAVLVPTAFRASQTAPPTPLRPPTMAPAIQPAMVVPQPLIVLAERLMVSPMAWIWAQTSWASRFRPPTMASRMPLAIPAALSTSFAGPLAPTSRMAATSSSIPPMASEMASRAPLTASTMASQFFTIWYTATPNGPTRMARRRGQFVLIQEKADTAAALIALKAATSVALILSQLRYSRIPMATRAAMAATIASTRPMVGSIAAFRPRLAMVDAMTATLYATKAAARA